MQLDFYKDMKRRIHSIALYGQFFALLSAKSITLERYGLTTLSLQITFVFFVLRLIMEKTLAEEECTLDDIAAGILDINADQFHLSLSETEAFELADLVVEEILGNRGNPIVFDPFEEDTEYRVYLNYITSKVGYRQTTKVANYRMLQDGFQLMLSTLEMEENMRLRLQDLIFEMEMHAKNYSRALDEISQLFQMLQIRQIEIDEQIVQVKENAARFGLARYEKLYEENYDLMSESKEKFLRHQQFTQEQIESIEHQIEQVELDAESIENLKTLQKIQARLNQTIMIFTTILAKLTDFSNEYDRQLKEQLRFVSRRHYAFKSLIVDKVDADADLLADIDRFFRPLFFQDFDKMLQISHAFEYKRLYQRAESGTYEEINEEFDEKRWEEEKEKQRRKIQTYERNLSTLLSAIATSSGHRLSLKAFDAPAGFMPDLETARVQLTAWSDMEFLDFDTLRKEAAELFMEERDSYNMPLTLNTVLEAEPSLLSFQGLRIQKGEGEVEYKLQEGPLQYIVRVDDLLFELVERSEHESK